MYLTPTVIRSLVHLPEDYHLVLVGYGEKRPELEALITELGLTERVHLLGLRTDVPNILKESDVVVSPVIVKDSPSLTWKAWHPAIHSWQVTWMAFVK